MRVLLDGHVPRPLQRALREIGGHEVVRIQDMGWGRVQNGVLLAAADREFDALVTADKDFRDLPERRREIAACARLGVVFLSLGRVTPETILPLAPWIDVALRELTAGGRAVVSQGRDASEQAPERCPPRARLLSCSPRDVLETLRPLPNGRMLYS